MSDVRLFSPTDKVGLPRVGNQAKPLKDSEKNIYIFCTNLEQMFKRMVTDLDTQSMTFPQKCQVAATSTARAVRSS